MISRELKLKLRKELLESKENVDPLTMAPEKKKKQKQCVKTSSCRMGNMIVKRNSWNLAFEPLKPVFQKQAPSVTRTADWSVYDFD